MNKAEENFETRMSKAEEKIESHSVIVYKACGALIILSIVVQLLGPIVVDKVFGQHQPKIEFIEK